MWSIGAESDLYYTICLFNLLMLYDFHSLCIKSMILKSAFWRFQVFFYVCGIPAISFSNWPTITHSKKNEKRKKKIPKTVFFPSCFYLKEFRITHIQHSFNVSLRHSFLAYFFTRILNQTINRSFNKILQECLISFSSKF